MGVERKGGRKGRGEGTHELLVVHGSDGGISLGLLAVGDEAESTGPSSSGLAIAGRRISWEDRTAKAVGTHVMTMQSRTCPNCEKASRRESLLVPLRSRAS